MAERLRQNPRLEDYIGPVHWDILAEDWECWRQGVPVEEAARRHIEAIEKVRRGIVLLHDGSEDDSLRPRNRTMQMTTEMIPLLKKKGYRFAGLEAVPPIRSAIDQAARGCFERASR